MKVYRLERRQRTEGTPGPIAMGAGTLRRDLERIFAFRHAAVERELG